MPNPRRSQVDDALARAVVYRTLSLGFLPPTRERLHSMGAHDRFRTATLALRRLAGRGGGEAVEAAARRLSWVPSPDEGALSAAYRRLFGHTARGAISACETEYGPGSGFQQPQQLADISGYYLAFGLRPVVRADTRPDHIASECEFMDFLSRKEALYLSHGIRQRLPRDGVSVTRGAERTFLRDHLGRFGRAFAVRVVAEDGEGFFGAMGSVLSSFIEAECQRAGVPAGPVDLVVRSDAADDTPMACGSACPVVPIAGRP